MNDYCCYGYDNETYFRDIGAGQAIAADMPGNHENGHNVAYFSGMIRWRDTNYASNDATDNIFAPEPDWGADADAHIRQ